MLDLAQAIVRTGFVGYCRGPYLQECVQVSGVKVRSLVVLSNHSVFHRWSAQTAALVLLSSEELMSCCVADTNGCLKLRRRAFPLGQVSAEWSRCPSSMERSARDSVAPLRRTSAGWTHATIGRLSTGVGRTHSVTVRKASLTAPLLTRHNAHLLTQQTL